MHIDCVVEMMTQGKYSQYTRLDNHYFGLHNELLCRSTNNVSDKKLTPNSQSDPSDRHQYHNHGTSTCPKAAGSIETFRRTPLTML